MHGMASEPASPSFRLDIDGIRFSHGAAATTVSPVFSLWLTFVLMYIGEPQLVACECFTAGSSTLLGRRLLWEKLAFTSDA